MEISQMAFLFKKNTVGIEYRILFELSDDSTMCIKMSLEYLNRVQYYKSCINFNLLLGDLIKATKFVPIFSNKLLISIINGEYSDFWKEHQYDIPSPREIINLMESK